MNKTNKVAWLFIVGLLFCLSLISASLQATDINSDSKNLLGVKSNNQNLSLLDPSRLRFYNSYTFSYFSSGKNNGSFGVYTTTLNYQLSNPLSLTLSLNYLHQPLSVFGRDDLGIKSSIYPNFQLNYRPNKNFSFMLNILTCPPPYGWGNENLRWEEKK